MCSYVQESEREGGLRMTILGWIGYAFVVIMTVCVCGAIAMQLELNVKAARRLVFSATFVVAIVAMLVMRWYFANTASGQRALTDQRSNLNNGIERIVTVYTANGDVIAQYEGKIDIAANDGGYIKFDFDGKRYIYYNCFVETIAALE